MRLVHRYIKQARPPKKRTKLTIKHIVASPYDHLKWFALCGLVIGISCYFQPSTQYLFIFLAIGMFLYFFRKIKWWKNILNVLLCSAIIASTMIVVMLPWAVRSFEITNTVSARAMRPAPWQGMWEGFGEGEDYNAIRKQVMKEMGYSIDNIPTFSPDYYIILDKTVERLENPMKAIMDDGITYELIQREYGEDIVYGSAEYQAILRQKVLKGIKDNPLWVLKQWARRIPRSLFYISETGLEYYPRDEKGGVLWGEHYASDMSILQYLREKPLVVLYTIFNASLKILFATLPLLFLVVLAFKRKWNWRNLAIISMLPLYFAAIHIPTFTCSFKTLLPGSIGYILMCAYALYLIFWEDKNESRIHVC